MQVGLQDQTILISWTDPTSNSYADLCLNESTPDLLVSDSPTLSPAHQQRHHHHNPHEHQHHLLQQRPHIHDRQLVTSSSTAYSSRPYTTASDAGSLGHFGYENKGAFNLIPRLSPGMRTGSGGGGRVEGSGCGRRGWKRKREEVSQPNTMDASQRCDVCGEQGSGHYFGALVCLPCKSFFIRCTKDGRPNFSNQCGGRCDVLKGGRVRCQHCRFQKCINAGMYRKEKPEAVEPAEGQLLCKVCGDIANGVHFGVTTCEGCKKFFRRGLKENRTYNCKGNQHCSINPRMRNNCRYCRYQKCLFEGMSREAIKMGRPKKGDLSYRKPLKNNRVKSTLTKDFYEKQAHESNRSSMSSDFDQDDVSASEDVFNPMSAVQLDMNHQQLNSQIQHNQQSNAYSLGSLLHDCITVQDWDQKVDINDLTRATDRVTSHSTGTDSAVEESKVISHMRHTSPTILSEMLSRQLHEQQHQHRLSQQQLLHGKVLNPLQDSLQEAYQVNNSDTSAKMEIITELEFPNEHGLSANRAIKVENDGLHDGPGDEFSEGAVLENMRNLETDSKSDFQSYQLHSLDTRSAYCLNDHRAALSAISNNTTVVSISHINPGVNSQLVSISVPPQSVLYATHGHPESVIIRSIPHPSESITMIQAHEQRSTDKSVQNNLNMDADQLMEANGSILPSNRSQHIITCQGSIKPTNFSNIATSNHSPRVNNISLLPWNVFNQVSTGTLQQFPSEITNESSVEGSSPLACDSSDATEVHTVEHDPNFTILSPSSQNSVTSLPAPHPSSSQSIITVQPIFPGIKNPIAALIQQHRTEIQSGQPIPLSRKVIEELLQTVNAEQQQRILSDSGSFKNERIINEKIISEDLGRPSGDDFLLHGQQQQLGELGHYNRQTPPTPSRSYHVSSPSNHYQRNSPINQSMSQVQQKHFQNHTPPISDSGINDQEFMRGYGNNNININNNSFNSNQHSNYISTNHTQHSPNNQSNQQISTYDDSFNSSLIRDSTLLHEINKIFLAIDNSCETFGCSHQSSVEDFNKADDSAMFSSMSADEFVPEYSHLYWHGFKSSERFVAMTPEREKIIHDVLDAFHSLQKTYLTNEPEYINRKMSPDQLDHWHHIQRRIARHVIAGQRFCRNIPGYFRLDIQDRISLGKHVGFGLMVLIACTEFYDPEYKRFKHIWNWIMPMQNPLFSYKVHLLSLGDRIHELEVDRTEASMLSAISMTSVDCPGLLKPEVVCEVRDALLDALKAHISTKTEPTLRLSKLLSVMPQVRLMTVWYNSLMKKMSLPSDVLNNKISKSKFREQAGTENSTDLS